MAARKKKQENPETPVQDSKTPANGNGADYPIRPGPQRPETPIEKEMISAWDPENPLTLEGHSSEDEEPMDFITEGAGLEEAIHADEYRRISPDEFDEFDSLLDEEGQSLGVDLTALSSPQLRLLSDVSEAGSESIFDEPVQPAEQFDGFNAAAPDGDLPVDVAENQSEATASPAVEPTTSLYPAAASETPPVFEDRGMGAGFFVANDDMPPEELTPEEAEASLPPQQPPTREVEPQQFVADLFFAPGPTVEIHPAPPVIDDLPPDLAIQEKEVTSDRISKLMTRAEMARRRINDEIDSIELARELLELIRSATTLILSGKDKYEEAERSLNEVEYRLSYSRRVKVWSDAIAYRLLAYETSWLLVLGLGALFIPSLLSAMIVQLSGIAPSGLPDFILSDDLFLGISTALWGGLGGVVGAMYALWRHVSLKQDFNPQHKMWYYTQPVMGIPIGVVIFLIVRIGIGYTIDGNLDFSSPYGIYMLAWVAGFQQNILYEIIRQMLKIFRIQN